MLGKKVKICFPSLRDRNSQLESENERLQSENKSKYGRKPPASTNEKLQMDKFSLEEKIRGLEVCQGKFCDQICRYLYGKNWSLFLLPDLIVFE